MRCGPWDEREGGIHVCRKCGRLDPLDFIDDVEEPMDYSGIPANELVAPVFPEEVDC